jgi:hypothetical protein
MADLIELYKIILWETDQTQMWGILSLARKKITRIVEWKKRLESGSADKSSTKSELNFSFFKTFFYMII